MKQSNRKVPLIGVTIQVDVETYDKIYDTAYTEGTSISKWCREVIKEKLEINNNNNKENSKND